jgi:hypothetical protein
MELKNYMTFVSPACKDRLQPLIPTQSRNLHACLRLQVRQNREGVGESSCVILEVVDRVVFKRRGRRSLLQHILNQHVCTFASSTKMLSLRI